MLPVHDAAVVVPVLLVALLARLTTLIWMVSVEPTPTGPIVKSRVEVVVVVCAITAPAVSTSVNAILLKNMNFLSR
jgi:hypothetical protein